MSSDLRVGIGISDEPLKENIESTLLRHFSFFGLDEDVDCVLTDDNSVIEKCQNNLTVPYVYVAVAQDPDEFPVDKFIRDNVFRVAFLPSKKELADVREKPSKTLSCSTTLEKILRFSCEVGKNLQDGAGFLERKEFDRRIDHEVASTVRGYYGEGDIESQQKMRSLRGEPRIISRIEAAHQALTYYLSGEHKPAPRETLSLNFLNDFDGLTEMAFHFLTRALEMKEKIGSGELKSDPLGQVIVRNYLKRTEDLLDFLTEAYTVKGTREFSRFARFRTSTYNQLFVANLGLSVNEPDKFFLVKRLTTSKGLDAEKRVYRTLVIEGQKRQKTLEIIEGLKQKEGPEPLAKFFNIQSLDNNVRGTGMTLRELFYYSHLPEIKTPGMHPSLEAGLFLDKYLLLEFVGKFPKNLADLTEENSFSYFNMLPLMDEHDKKFSRQFKLIMEFERNRSIAYSQHIKFPDGFLDKQRNFGEELARNTFVLAKYLWGNEDAEEERKHMGLASSAIETGLHDRSMVVVRDANYKNFLFYEPDTENIDEMISFFESTFNEYGAEVLHANIQEIKKEIDFDKYTLTHPFESRKHNFYGRVKLSKKDWKATDYHFLFCRAYARALRSFIDKNLDEDAVPVIENTKGIILKIEKGEYDFGSEQTVSELNNFLINFDMLGYDTIEDCFDDYDWMGLFRNARHFEAEVNYGVMTDNWENKQYLNGLMNYFKFIDASLDNLIAYRKKVLGGRPRSEPEDFEEEAKSLMREMDKLDPQTDSQAKQEYVKLLYLKNTYHRLRQEIKDQIKNAN